MANPQKEDGYVGIENHLFEALYKSGFTLREIKILLCIIRYTYGFNKKTHSLSLSFISEQTGVKRQHISESLKRLHEGHVITISRGSGIIPQTLSIQKNYEEWYCYRNGNCSQKSDSSVPEKGTVVFPKKEPYKYIIKDKPKNNNYIEHLPSWFDEVWNAYPNKKGKNKISKKCYKDIEAAGKEKLLKCIENIKAYKEQHSWYEYQHGSTFFNGGWRDYQEEAELRTQGVGSKGDDEWD